MPLRDASAIGNVFMPIIYTDFYLESRGNLNTHTLGSLYEAFPAARARELANRLEIHYTPKHGSWLNIAEIVRIISSVPVSLDTRHRHFEPETTVLAGGHQCGPPAGELAVHHR